MNNCPAPHSRHRNAFAAVALLLLAAGLPMMADSVLVSTNGVTMTSAPASTNAAPQKHGITITADVNDDGSPADPGKGHTATIDLDNGDLAAGLLIPLAGIVGVFGMPVVVVFLAFYFSYRRRRETLATVREFLNKGQPVPPQLLESLGSRYAATTASPVVRKRSDLARGFQLTFIGLGITLALWVHNPHSTTWGWGLIPTVMGLGYLASGWVQSCDRAPDRDELPPRPGGPPAPQ